MFFFFQNQIVTVHKASNKSFLLNFQKDKLQFCCTDIHVCIFHIQGKVNSDYFATLVYFSLHTIRCFIEYENSTLKADKELLTTQQTKKHATIRYECDFHSKSNYSI